MKKKEKLQKITWHDAAACRVEGKEWLYKENPKLKIEIQKQTTINVISLFMIDIL